MPLYDFRTKSVQGKITSYARMMGRGRVQVGPKKFTFSILDFRSEKSVRHPVVNERVNVVFFHDNGGQRLISVWAGKVPQICPRANRRYSKTAR